MLYDSKGRQYLIELQPGKDFHYHRGVLAHDTVIGSADGSDRVRARRKPVGVRANSGVTPHPG